MGVGPEYRTPDMIQGKWTDLNKQCLFFNACYNRKKNAGVPSGESLLTWTYEAANKEYKATKLQSFQHKAVWEYLHTHQKWLEQHALEVRTTRPSKRSKTNSSSSSAFNESQTSDAHTFNLNDEADEDDVVVELPRPPGRRSAKAKGGSSSSSAAPDNNPFTNIAAQLTRIGDEAVLRRQLKEKKYDNMSTLIQMKDMDQLRRSTEGMTDEELQINERINEAIRRKYRDM